MSRVSLVERWDRYRRLGPEDRGLLLRGTARSARLADHHKHCARFDATIAAAEGDGR